MKNSLDALSLTTLFRSDRNGELVIRRNLSEAKCTYKFLLKTGAYSSRIDIILVALYGHGWKNVTKITSYMNTSKTNLVFEMMYETVSGYHTSVFITTN